MDILTHILTSPQDSPATHWPVHRAEVEPVVLPNLLLFIHIFNDDDDDHLDRFSHKVARCLPYRPAKKA
jgi:hypothetical protein